MADYTLTVTGRAITLPQGFPSQISNTEGADRVKFNCDSEYSGYALVAVFKNGERGKAYPVAIPADRSYVSIPSAPLKRRGWLYIGLFGVDGLKVLPTLWASPVEIKEGTDTGGIYEEESASLIPGLIERVADVEADVDELETAVDGLEDDVTEIDLRVGALEDDVDELEEAVEGKQDTIADLDTIRSGAAAGATALQSVPIATDNAIGGVKKGNASLGVMLNSSAQFVVQRASDSGIANRNEAFRPITPFNMDTAFRTCITDPAQELTDYNKECACNTIGAEYIGAYMKKYAENTLSEPANYLEVSQNIYGEPFALKDGYIVMIKIPEHGGSGGKAIRLFVNGTGFRSVGNAYLPANKSVSGFRLLKNMLSVEYLSPTVAGSLAAWFNMADYFGNNVWGEGYRATFPSAESFGVAASAGEVLPADTKIQVYTMQTD